VQLWTRHMLHQAGDCGRSWLGVVAAPKLPAQAGHWAWVSKDVCGCAWLCDAVQFDGRWGLGWCALS
jgi:hypothetical protein